MNSQHDQEIGRQELFSKVEGLPHDFDTIKTAFGRQNVFGDISSQEVKYLCENPGSRYNIVLKKVESYPNYIDYLPEGAIVRKLKVITSYLANVDIRNEYIFFTEEEIKNFVENTSVLILSLIKEKLSELHLLEKTDRFNVVNIYYI